MRCALDARTRGVLALTSVLMLPKLGGCTAPQSTAPPATELQPTFDAAALFDDLVRLVGIPRVLGDPARSDGIDQLAHRMEAAGATVTRQELRGHDPRDGHAFELTNLFGSVRADAPKQFVLATHFDIRPWAESDPNPAYQDHPIPGANDGSSGVAVLFALLPRLRDELGDDVGFTIALFDGEELGRPELGGYCVGSTFFADNLNEAPPNMARASFGIVLDMVGDADLRIAQEPLSRRQNPKLVDAIWDTARALGASQFSASTYPHAIIDDHVQLSRAGIPSVLLIDYEYDAWHTHADDIDRVSGESLATVAAVVLETVRSQCSHPPASTGSGS